MKRILLSSLALSTLLCAFEPAETTLPAYGLDAFPAEIKAVLVGAIAQKESFEQAVADIKNIRAVSKSFAQLVDRYSITHDLITYLAQTYNQDAVVVALYLGTPQAKQWLKLNMNGGTIPGTKKKIIANQALLNRTEYLYNNIISKAITLENLDTQQSLEWLKTVLPERSKKAQYQSLQEAVKKGNTEALQYILKDNIQLNYTSAKTSPELETLIKKFENLKSKISQARIYGLVPEAENQKEAEQIVRIWQLNLAKTREGIRLLLDHGAQMGSRMLPTYQRLVKINGFNADDIALFQKTQRVLQKSKK